MEFTAEQQQQYQYQQQQQQAYQYDPSQYDPQSTASYYAYPNQEQLLQQQYQYYPPQDSYSQQYPQFNQETASIHPPGVPFDPSAHHNQPTVYYQPQPPVDPQQQYQVIPVSGSDSAAASASLTGNIDVVQKDYPPPQIQTTDRGGRRGGRPFRGGGRGHDAPPRRGRHSGSKHFASIGTSGIPNSVIDPSAAAAVMSPSALVPGQATSPALVPAAPVQRPPRMTRCELCRVDCNTSEILEQHKNGKRHKKNLKSREDMQKQNTVITGQQSLQVPSTGSEVVQFKKVEGSEENQHQQEALSSMPNTDDKKETEQQKDITNKSEASTSGPAETNRKLEGPSEARGRGLKRKMRGGRGGKNIKNSEGSRRPVEPPKPVGGIPFICELCNVKCESQVVFDSHLAGKKHNANMKRFQGHQALYGEAGLQTFYPPNLSAPSPSFIPQIQQDMTDPQVVLAQLLNYVLTQAQVPGLAVPQVSLPAATQAQVPGLAVPQVSLPAATQAQVPGLAVPQVSLPAATQAQVPGLAVPQVSLPAETQAQVPGLAVPQVSLPAASQAQVPGLAVPQVSLPEATQAQIQQNMTDPQVVLALLLNYVLTQAQVLGLAVPQVSLPAATQAQVPGLAVHQVSLPAATQAQIQQDITDPQVVLAQLLNYVLTQAQVPGLAVPQVSLPAATLAPSQIPLSSLEVQYSNQFPQGSLVTPEMRKEVYLKAEAAANSEALPFAGNVEANCRTSESEKNEASQQQTFTASAGTAVKGDNGAFVLENKPVISPMDNLICATPGKPSLSSTSEKDAKTEPGSINNLEKSEMGSIEDDLKEHTA